MISASRGARLEAQRSTAAWLHSSSAFPAAHGTASVNTQLLQVIPDCIGKCPSQVPEVRLHQQDFLIKAVKTRAVILPFTFPMMFTNSLQKN